MPTDTEKWWVDLAIALEAARRARALEPVDQFQRGLLTVEELAAALARIVVTS
jgi:hypothetical protein